MAHTGRAVSLSLVGNALAGTAGTAAALIGMRGTFVAAGVLCLVGGVVTALLVTGAVREQTRRS